jgi:hypothetical protein
MIEFAILDNGPSDLPIKQLPGGGLVPDGDLEAMHRSMQRTVIDQIRKAIFAEQAGFHYYFFTEHHFQPEGNEFSPNPLLLGAAIATRTKHIRLGQMANIVSWWHPIRLAEQAARLPAKRSTNHARIGSSDHRTSRIPQNSGPSRPNSCTSRFRDGSAYP